MATGKATARPARSIAATSRRFAMLKMNPPTSASTMLLVSALRTLSMKLSGPPVEPIVKARTREMRTIPIA